MQSVTVQWSVELPSKKKQKEDPWWFSPSIFQVTATDKAIRHCQLPSLLLQKIFSTLVKARYPSRAKRPRKSWVENVTVDGALYQLICYADEKTKMIVATDIRPPKEMRKTHIHT
jgi:hypothetical protein